MTGPNPVAMAWAAGVFCISLGAVIVLIGASYKRDDGRRCLSILGLHIFIGFWLAAWGAVTIWAAA